MGATASPNSATGDKNGGRQCFVDQNRNLNLAEVEKGEEEVTTSRPVRDHDEQADPCERIRLLGHPPRSPPLEQISEQQQNQDNHNHHHHHHEEQTTGGSQDGIARNSNSSPISQLTSVSSAASCDTNAADDCCCSSSAGSTLPTTSASANQTENAPQVVVARSERPQERRESGSVQAPQTAVTTCIDMCELMTNTEKNTETNTVAAVATTTASHSETSDESEPERVIEVAATAANARRRASLASRLLTFLSSNPSNNHLQQPEPICLRGSHHHYSEDEDYEASGGTSHRTNTKRRADSLRNCLDHHIALHQRQRKKRNKHQLAEAAQLMTERQSNAAAAGHCYRQNGEHYHHLKEEPLPPPPPATVAGVGGTITTVTRSRRKTAPLPRLVAKNGQVNLFVDNIDKRQYVRDLFTTMIDIKWRYNLLAATLGFVFSWLFFACIWYLVLYFHQDLKHENDPNWSPCIVNVHSFSAALLFSIETQSTLGFGSRIISVECPAAIFIFCIQLIFGVVIECLIVGMVFAKLSRPAKRSQTIMFSKAATVCLRERQMCLTFRVGDVRSKSHIIGATIRATLVSQKISLEGEITPFYHHRLDVKIDDSTNNLLLIWPLTIVHLIDETSPLYELDAQTLQKCKFEIIIVLEGTVESTGQSIQVRSSYLPSEVKWGQRFEPVVSTHGFGYEAQTIIDYNKFNRLLPVDTPQCSPRQYYEQVAVASRESCLRRQRRQQHQPPTGITDDKEREALSESCSELLSSGDGDSDKSCNCQTKRRTTATARRSLQLDYANE